MRKRTLASRLSIGFCILILAVAFTNTGFAQGEEAVPEIYQGSYVQVNPGKTIEFEQLVKGALPFSKAQGVNQMLSFKTAVFGKSNKYTFFILLDDPARVDAQLSEVQSSVPNEYVPYLSAINQTIDGSHEFMLITRPDLSIVPGDDYDLKMGVMFSIGVVPGRIEDFEKALKEAVAAIGKTNIKGILVGKVGLGGNFNEYLMTILYDSFSGILENGQAIQRELAAAELAPQTGIVAYQKSEVMIYAPELSIQPEAQ